MPAAEDDYGITGRAAVGAYSQSPPDSEGIHNRDPSAALKQSLDKAFSGVGLAGAGGADNRYPVVERFNCKLSQRRVAVACNELNPRRVVEIPAALIDRP
jgi:hypothetical protein